jgi:putative transposase
VVKLKHRRTVRADTQPRLCRGRGFTPRSTNGCYHPCAPENGMSNLPCRLKPGYSALRQHRWSAAGAEYFVTIRIHPTAASLCDPKLLCELERERDALQAEGGWNMRTWIVMPDHLHLLFVLGSAFSLAECLRRFKGRPSPKMRLHALSWQEGYYEHRMRAEDDRCPVFFYVFLNPYRANLVPISQKWTGYFCSAHDWSWFAPLTNSCGPFPEWLD